MYTKGSVINSGQYVTESGRSSLKLAQVHWSWPEDHLQHMAEQAGWKWLCSSSCQHWQNTIAWSHADHGGHDCTACWEIHSSACALLWECVCSEAECTPLSLSSDFNLCTNLNHSAAHAWTISICTTWRTGTPCPQAERLVRAPTLPFFLYFEQPNSKFEQYYFWMSEPLCALSVFPNTPVVVLRCIWLELVWWVLIKTPKSLKNWSMCWKKRNNITFLPNLSDIVN